MVQGTKRLLALLLALVLCVSLFPAAFAEGEDEGTIAPAGDGVPDTPEDPAEERDFIGAA